MERKLLSLPSFFVLLLVAGIAFLTVPVVDVHATPPGAVTAQVIDPAGDADAPTSADDELTTAGMTDVVVLKIADTAVKLSSASGVTNAAGFGVEDLLVTVNHTVPDPDQSDPLEASKIRLTPIAAGATLPGGITGTLPGANQWFIVGVEVPENKRGTITVQVKAAHAELGSSFQEAGAGTDPYAGGSNAPTNGASNTIYYDTYNPVPTVTIHPLPANTALDAATPSTLRTRAGKEAFLVRFIIADADSTDDDPGFDGTPSFTAPTDLIELKDGSVLSNQLSEVTAATADNTYWVHAYIQATSGASSVLIGVKAGAVTDKNGATNVATPITTSGTPPTLTDSNAKEVMVDTDAPRVVVSLAETLADSTKPKSSTNVVKSIGVTITSYEGSTGTTKTLKTALDSADGSNVIVNDEVTVVGGTMTTVTPVIGFDAIFTATITPSATAAKVEVTVQANALKDSAGNSNLASQTAMVTTGFTGVVQTGTGVGDALPTGRKGFTFNLPAITPSSSRFVVIAKFKDTVNPVVVMNGISGVTPIDIKDSIWQDLRDFLAYDGGTIDLTGPSGTKAKDLVISEIMWGSDNGLSDPAMSQWIELYNTKTTRGTGNTGTIPAGTWTIEFHAGAASTAAVSDRFSNRKLGQAHWNIPDTSGGAYGQSGRTKLTPGTAGSLRDLVSMRRKIDYTKVEKNDHKAAGTADDEANRTEQLKGIPDGALAGSWEASTSRRNLSGTRKGTPGTKPLAIITQTVVNRNGIVFNEIGNRTGSTNDWIELYNRGSAEVKINKYELSKVGDNGKDEKLFQFESNQDVTIPAKGYLLVLNTDPSGTNIAEGADVNDSDGEDKGNRGGSSVRYYQNSGLNIPDDKFMLILRTEPKLGSHEKIADIAGNQFVSNEASATEVWPLRATRKPLDANALNDLKKDDGKSWVRDFGKALFHHEEWKTSDVKGPGYKRSADSLNSGTPGYPNNAVQSEVKSDGLTHANPVVISEIMYGSGNGRVPQWIELYNPSTTQTVNLEKWTLEIQNTKSPDEDLRTETNSTLTLKKLLVHPNQTVLIVSTHGSTSKNEHFPSSRVYNLWDNHKEDLDMSSRRDAVLSSIGFYLELSDPRKRVVDEIGNLDGNKRTNDDPTWSLPGGNLEDGGRASMIRREGSFGDGTVEDAWISAAIVDGLQKVGINDLYFGSPDDVGTPGYRAGGPLPVQLSSFYSKRNDAGAVVITWSTESELDNAGFNILRSLSRAGEFTRINAQLIPGAGTTGEKNTYTWTDTSARPNVVYYYQIEDVSLDGDHRTLRTTRLRGYVGAAGKATTIWGELKSRD